MSNPLPTLFFSNYFFVYFLNKKTKKAGKTSHLTKRVYRPLAPISPHQPPSPPIPPREVNTRAAPISDPRDLSHQTWGRPRKKLLKFPPHYADKVLQGRLASAILSDVRKNYKGRGHPDGLGAPCPIRRSTKR